MAYTNAERQKRYREARLTAGENRDGDQRLSTYISSSAMHALRRLANRYGVTHRELIEKWIAADDDKIISTLEPKTPEWDKYFLFKRRRGRAKLLT